MDRGILPEMFPVLLKGQKQSLQTEDGKSATRQNLIKLPCLSNDFKVCVQGPCSSGKTALLFQTAISYALEGCKVSFITHVKFQSLPPSMDGVPAPDPMLMKQINIMYINDRHALLKYLASIHKTAPFPDAVIVDNLDYYASLPKEKDHLQVAASLCAHIIDAAAFVQSRRENTSSQTLRCLAMVSFSCSFESAESPFSQVCQSFFPTVLTVKELKDQKRLYHLTYKSENKGGTLVTYHLGNKIKVLDVMSNSELTGWSQFPSHESEMTEN